MSAAALAEGLSEAQRRAIMTLPIQRDFIPKHTGFQWSTLATLKSRRLINGVRDGVQGLGKDVQPRLTPLGLSVRAYLKEQAS